MGRIVVSALLVVALAAPPARAGEQRGDHFVVITHFDGEAAAKEALQAAEEAWDLARDPFGAPRRDLDDPYQVHLFRTRQDYADALRATAPGAPSTGCSRADPGARRVDVLVWPACTDAELAERGLPAATLRELARQAADMARCEGAPNFAVQPDWMVRGGTTWIAEQVLVDLGRASGDDADPWLSNCRRRVRTMVADGWVPEARSVLRDELDVVPEADRERLQMAIFGELSQTSWRHRRDKVLRRARSLDGTASYRDELWETVEREIGDKRLQDLTEALRGDALEWEPAWKIEAPSLEQTEDGWIQRADEHEPAVAWRTAGCGSGVFALTGNLRLARGEEAGVLVGHRPDGRYLAVCLTRAEGPVLYEQRDRLPGRRRLAAGENRALAPDATVSFELRVEADGLWLELEHERVLSADLEAPFPEDSPWGLVTGDGGVAVWTGVEQQARRR